jgi:hypothetical protein
MSSTELCALESGYAFIYILCTLAMCILFGLRGHADQGSDTTVIFSCIQSSFVMDGWGEKEHEI